MFQQVGKRQFTITGVRTISSTAGFTSRKFTNSHHKGVLIIVDRVSETGTATLDAQVEVLSKINNEWIQLEGASFHQWADGEADTRYLMVYPGLVGSDSDNRIELDTDNGNLCGQYLPKYWRLVMTTTGTTNVVSAEATYLP